MDDWGISGDGGAISVDGPTELLTYLVSSTRHCLPRCPKVYRIIDISRVCEFYIIRIAFAWYICVCGLGEIDGIDGKKGKEG